MPLPIVRGSAMSVCKALYHSAIEEDPPILYFICLPRQYPEVLAILMICLIQKQVLSMHMKEQLINSQTATLRQIDCQSILFPFFQK